MIIADTGFFFALANNGDRYHSAALSALEAINEPLITTYPVITETCYLLLSTGGNFAQGKTIAPSCSSETADRSPFLPKLRSLFCGAIGEKDLER